MSVNTNGHQLYITSWCLRLFRSCMYAINNDISQCVQQRQASVGHAAIVGVIEAIRRPHRSGICPARCMRSVDELQYGPRSPVSSVRIGPVEVGSAVLNGLGTVLDLPRLQPCGWVWDLLPHHPVRVSARARGWGSPLVLGGLGPPQANSSFQAIQLQRAQM